MERSPVTDAGTAVGLLLLATAVIALLSWVIQITEALVAATCGAAPHFASETYLNFYNCKDATESRYWTVMAIAIGAGLSYAGRAWLRREAKRDAERDKTLDAEMARIRHRAEHHLDA